jgi:S1-C subfamily serine protease
LKANRHFIFTLLLLLASFNQSYSVEAATIKLAMKKTSYSMYLGGKQQISVTVTGTKLSNVKWKSSNSKIGTVDNKGLVKAINVGKVSITASIPNTKAKAVATFTITKKVLNSQEIFKKVNPAVVKIELFNKYNQPVSSGSGFIVNANGTIVTNHHVIIDISEAQYVKVRLSDGRVYETNQVIDYNEKRDLAVLKITGARNLPTVQLGDSNKVETGEKVYALGSPLGISNTITEGIVSNNSIVLDDNQVYLQSSAPISHGNSGGVLVNRFGEIIGVNVATLVDGQNMNLAIPINDFKKMKLNNYNSLINVNQETYIPMLGEGKVYENEDNNDFTTADNIKYKNAWLNGSIRFNNDFDVYYFNLTDYATLAIRCSTIQTELSDSLTFGLFDENYNLIQWGEQEYNTTTQNYETSLIKDLAPGTYYISISPYSDTPKTFLNNPYLALLSVYSQ